MKKLFLSFSLLFVASLAMNTVSAQIDKGAKIEFSKEVHDYGNIKYDGDPYCSFEFNLRHQFSQTRHKINLLVCYKSRLVLIFRNNKNRRSNTGTIQMFI